MKKLFIALIFIFISNELLGNSKDTTNFRILDSLTYGSTNKISYDYTIEMSDLSNNKSLDIVHGAYYYYDNIYFDSTNSLINVKDNIRMIQINKEKKIVYLKAVSELSRIINTKDKNHNNVIFDFKKIDNSNISKFTIDRTAPQNQLINVQIKDSKIFEITIGFNEKYKITKMIIKEYVSKRDGDKILKILSINNISTSFSNLIISTNRFIGNKNQLIGNYANYELINIKYKK